MALTEKDVEYVAELAHLELTDAEIEQFLPQLDSILQYVQKLNQLETAGVEPMAQVAHPDSETLSLRSDCTEPSFTQDQALGNAPESGAGCFKVPRVIERE